MPSDALKAREITGWYGKLPSLGDFASRRMSPGFLEAWDDWLAGGLADWRARQPESWLDAYLASPSWRFLLMPGALTGVLSAGAWAGVLMPSVDRVGRYFPLTLVRPLYPMPGSVPEAQALLAWLEELDELTVSALQDDWNVDQLETALHRQAPWPQAPIPPAEAGAAPDSLAEWLVQVAAEPLSAGRPGRALWLAPDGAGGQVLRTTTGLPRGPAFSALLTDAAGAADSADQSITPR